MKNLNCLFLLIIVKVKFYKVFKDQELDLTRKDQQVDLTKEVHKVEYNNIKN